VYLLSSTHNNITWNNISNNKYNGIQSSSSSNNYILNNTFNQNKENGIWLREQSTNNEIGNNTVQNNTNHGIHVEDLSSDNEFKGNNISQNLVGIRLSGSPQNTLESNHMWFNYQVGLEVCCSIGIHYDQTISTSNKVNGGIVYYFYNLYNPSPLQFQDAGHITIAQSSEVTLRYTNLTYADPIFIALSTDSVVENCTITGSYYGLYLREVTHSYFINNTIESKNHGIHAFSFTDYNRFWNNQVFSNMGNGFNLVSSRNNSLLNNNGSSDNNYGLFMNSAWDNSIINCNISSNQSGAIYVHASDPVIIQGVNITSSYGKGIIGDASDNIMLIDNKISSNLTGIEMIKSDYINIEGNTIETTRAWIGHGVLLNLSNYGLIKNNSILSSGGNGYYLINSIGNNLFNNMAFSGITGINLSQSSENLVSNGSIEDNWDCAVRFIAATNNIVLNLTVFNNSYGIWADSNSFSNLIYHNNMLQSAYQQGYDQGNNLWNTSTEGNYWADYITGEYIYIDSDMDGIADLPVQIFLQGPLLI
jgi:parallel beta-helix repeat protein